MLVFHKALSIGFGPAVSIYIDEHEFMKFDCFGKSKGHYHIYDIKKNQTIYFSEISVHDQIHRTGLEITQNLKNYISKSKLNKVKNLCSENFENISIDKINIMKNKMMEYEEKYYINLR